MNISSAKVFTGSPVINYVTLKIMTDQGIYGLGDATLGNVTCRLSTGLPDSQSDWTSSQTHGGDGCASGRSCPATQTCPSMGTQFPVLAIVNRAISTYWAAIRYVINKAGLKVFRGSCRCGDIDLALWLSLASESAFSRAVY